MRISIKNNWKLRLKFKFNAPFSESTLLPFVMNMSIDLWALNGIIVCQSENIVWDFHSDFYAYLQVCFEIFHITNWYLLFSQYIFSTAPIASISLFCGFVGVQQNLCLSALYCQWGFEKFQFSAPLNRSVTRHLFIQYFIFTVWRVENSHSRTKYVNIFVRRTEVSKLRF